MGVNGIKFPDEMNDIVTLSLDDKVLISDASDAKKAKWVSIEKLNYIKTVSDKNLTCLATENNGDIASNTGITRKPKADSEIYIHVNGVMYEAGDGIDNKECYFTAPLETTPKTINTIQIGDILRWNGSVAGFQLETTDNITFIYLF